MAYTSTLTFTGPTSHLFLPSTFTVPIESVSFGFSTPITIGTGAGKLSFNDLTVTRSLDAFSPYLLTMCGSGGYYTTAALSVTAQGANSPLLVYTFGEVFCTSVSDAGSQHGGPVPLEQVALVFGKATITYFDPTTGQKTTGSWDVGKNTP